MIGAGSPQAADSGPRHHANGAFDAATGAYVIVKGDDLYEIAERFGVTVAELKTANKLDSDVIDVGQKLMIATGAGKESPTFTAQIIGTLGSPSATTTISGKQLPAAQPKFEGVIKDNAINSTQWWAPRIVPPKDAPNILFIMTDDAGFGIPSRSSSTTCLALRMRRSTRKRSGWRRSKRCTCSMAVTRSCARPSLQTSRRWA